MRAGDHQVVRHKKPGVISVPRWRWTKDSLCCVMGKLRPVLRYLFRMVWRKRYARATVAGIIAIFTCHLRINDKIGLRVFARPTNIFRTAHLAPPAPRPQPELLQPRRSPRRQQHLQTLKHRPIPPPHRLPLCIAPSPRLIPHPDRLTHESLQPNLNPL